MAQKTSGFTRKLEPHVKESDTGHAQSPAKKAPLPAKDSVLLGGEQTSDGRAAERRTGSRRSDGSAERMSARARKKREANLASLDPPPSRDEMH